MLRTPWQSSFRRILPHERSCRQRPKRWRLLRCQLALVDACGYAQKDARWQVYAIIWIILSFVSKEQKATSKLLKKRNSARGNKSAQIMDVVRCYAGAGLVALWLCSAPCRTAACRPKAGGGPENWVRLSGNCFFVKCWGKVFGTKVWQVNFRTCTPIATFKSSSPLPHWLGASTREASEILGAACTHATIRYPKYSAGQVSICQLIQWSSRALRPNFQKECQIGLTMKGRLRGSPRHSAALSNWQVYNPQKGAWDELSSMDMPPVCN